jgi:hypothetical protein
MAEGIITAIGGEAVWQRVMLEASNFRRARAVLNVKIIRDSRQVFPGFVALLSWATQNAEKKLPRLAIQFTITIDQ